MNPDIPPGDVEAVRVERGHVNDVMVVLSAAVHFDKFVQ